MRFWRGLLFFLCLKCTQGANMNFKKNHVLLFIAKTTEMKFSNKFAKKFYIIKNQILISNYMQAFQFGFLKTISWATVLDFSDRIQWRKKDQHKVYMYLWGDSLRFCVVDWTLNTFCFAHTQCSVVQTS